LDTTELLKISRDKSVEGREKLAKSVTSLFMENDGVMSDRERSLMLDILHRLVHDFEKSVRSIIAENLVDWSDIPQDLATFLANDDIDVAYPILSKSGVLKDENLIEIIHHRTMEHQMAIAIRQSVSENVTSALVEEAISRSSPSCWIIPAPKFQRPRSNISSMKRSAWIHTGNRYSGAKSSIPNWRKNCSYGFRRRCASISPINSPWMWT